MPKVNLYCIIDKKMPNFSKVQTCPTDEVPKRELAYAVNNQPESQFARFPEDYALYQVGTIDIETGEGEMKKILICSCSDLKN